MEAARSSLSWLISVTTSSEGFIGPCSAVVNSAQSHGAYSGQNGHFAARYYAHFMLIAALRGMILRVIAAYNAAHRFGKRAAEEAVSIIFEQAAVFHNQGGNNNIGCVSAYEGKNSPEPQGGLRCLSRAVWKIYPRLKLILPFLSYLYNFAAEFMPYDNGMLAYVVGHALVVGALYGRLVAGHAYGIRYDVRQYLVFLFSGSSNSSSRKSFLP